MFIKACPGAGKTRVVTAKIQREIGKARDNNAEIACLTYTNAARDEIASRVRLILPPTYAECVHIATVHGFLLDAILRPWANLIPSFDPEFHLAIPGDPRHEAAVITVGSGNLNRTDTLRRDSQHYWMDENGNPQGADEPQLIKRLITELERNSCMDFAGVVYNAYRLIVDHERVRRAVAHRFSWFLIDEYQDCNPVHLRIYEAIAFAGECIFFVIGDLGQLIFGFNGVTRNVFYKPLRL